MNIFYYMYGAMKGCSYDRGSGYCAVLLVLVSSGELNVLFEQ